MAPRKVLVQRHTAIVRITHWINVLALWLLLMSGLQIFNAHPALYWGQKSTFSQPWLAMEMGERGGRPVGVTTLGDYIYDTTGVFGYSGKVGRQEPRGFPSWATLPSWRDLATGRRWHFFWAWVFVINGVVYVGTGLIGPHVRRDLWPSADDLRPSHLWHEIVSHARLQFPKGEAARVYNVLQKLTYLIVIFLLLPLMIATGLTMSPGVDAAAPWLLSLFGGRQSARSIHFISANLIVLFVLVHVAMVIASGTWNNLRSMVTGRYAIEVEDPARAGAAE